MTNNKRNERIYALFHLGTIFLIPFVFIAVSYAGIVYQVLVSHEWISNSSCNSTPNFRDSSATADQQRGDQWSVTLKTPSSTSRGHQSFQNTYETQGSQSSTTPNGQVWLQRAKKNTMKTTLLILFAYLLFWLPYNALLVRRLVQSHQSHRNQETEEWSSSYWDLLYTLIILNSVVNPFLYGWHTAQLGKLFEKAGKKCCKSELGPFTVSRIKQRTHFAADRILVTRDNRRNAQRHLYA